MLWPKKKFIQGIWSWKKIISARKFPPSPITFLMLRSLWSTYSYGHMLSSLTWFPCDMDRRRNRIKKLNEAEVWLRFYESLLWNKGVTCPPCHKTYYDTLLYQGNGLLHALPCFFFYLTSMLFLWSLSAKVRAHILRDSLVSGRWLIESQSNFNLQVSLVWFLTLLFKSEFKFRTKPGFS